MFNCLREHIHGYCVFVRVFNSQCPDDCIPQGAMVVKDREELDQEVLDQVESDREESAREESAQEVSGPAPSAQAVVDRE